MNPITYSLTSQTGNPLKAYDDIRKCTYLILTKANQLLSKEVEDYQDFVKNTGMEDCRSYHEYMFEYIMLGIYWKNHESKSRRTSTSTLRLMHKLFLLRKSQPGLKPAIDKLRGRMISSLLFRESNSFTPGFSYGTFHKLLCWMDATGEYPEEVKRLNGWLRYASTLDSTTLEQLIGKTWFFSEIFEDNCKELLGKYTSNVSLFVDRAASEYRNREDFALAGRKEIEYHLNMVGAEILNRELRAGFRVKEHKVVLLPSCMRMKSATECKAQNTEFGQKCTGCTKECNIGKICQEIRLKGIETYIIPHSSDFSKSLKKWKSQPGVALVGVACVLNLMLGGYEMLELGIPSQCVYLDICGCKKHWDSKGVATSLNIDQLKNVLDIQEPAIKSLVSKAYTEVA
ncbi:MAG: DUF116 domain-containing protein [Bacteroidetes bacterium]|nr:DUF116 domain-containing protein [Bacteroidota bacterium]